MSIVFGSDPVHDAVQDALARLAAGQPVDDVERQVVDFKEEAGRRDKSGQVGPGSLNNEAAADKLTGEAICMANTPGGGALIVGVADDGTLIGAATGAEWLRKRVYEKSQRLLTIDVREAHVNGVRVLVLMVPQAVEPIRWNGKINWRVGDACVEVDGATWHAKRMARLNYDWSAEESTVSSDAARPQAISIARDFLLESGDPSAAELAGVPDAAFLRRLNAVTGQGMLTNAGVLTFVGRGSPALDYVHREYAGADSTTRVRRSDRSLLEELSEVFVSLDAHNATRHLQSGLAIGQVRDIPRLAAREAIVNGVAHREWGSADPTTVEHVGRTLRVTSPGGFYGGVDASNIITHPSQSRNRALTQLLADLKVAEREGIGVDRMVREMIRVGHAPPDIREISGPYVRASLIGDNLDEAWISWLALLVPKAEAQDINSLLLLRTLVDQGWIDVARAAPIIQLTVAETRGAISKLANATINGQKVLRLVEGVPESAEPVWKLSSTTVNALAKADRAFGLSRPSPTRAQIARSYAQARGRISTTELGSLVRASGTNVGATLKALEQEGLLEPSSPARRGRGFYYKWVGPE
ncbi:ATP-binding protein [Nocardioides kribbensis]|uniref:ATP-binding protein n=1 Tax=Nocardioides kribbensis TaxID=305517 RepID=A0ABV1NY98_9ACTN